MRKILPSNLCQRTIIKRISFDFNLFNPGDDGDDGDERVLRGTCRDLMTSEPAEDLQLSERYYIPYCRAALAKVSSSSSIVFFSLQQNLVK